MKKTRGFLLAASTVLAMVFTFFCDVQAANDQEDFFGIWVEKLQGGTIFLEINKNTLIFTTIENEVNKEEERIVEWKKDGKFYVIYSLQEDNNKMVRQVHIDSYSSLKLTVFVAGLGLVVHEFNKSSSAELNKAVKPFEQAKAKEQEEFKKRMEKNKEIEKLKKEFIDERDGKKYKYVIIGKQTWMAQNLDYAGPNEDIGACTGGKYENCKKYGAIYTWNEAKKACPKGWHLPNNKEWQTLIDFAGGKKSKSFLETLVDESSHGGEIAAKKLKAIEWSKSNCKGKKEETTKRGSIIVTEYDNCSTNEFGFTALPGGRYSGDYNDGGIHGRWWSANGSYDDMANIWSMSIEFDGISEQLKKKNDINMFSVRCIKD